MCHGHIDPKTLLIEAEARYRAAQPAPSETRKANAPASLPPELMGGLKGVLARISAAAGHWGVIASAARRTAR